MPAKQVTQPFSPSPALLPLGAMLLAGSLNAAAQDANGAREAALSTVTVTERAEAAEGKDALRATQTRIGKAQQDIRDIPQSLTVVTEKLMDDRHIDTMKEALKNTAGISFLAAEGGEEDIRLRGFALQSTGDVFVDGMRDPAFYDRDTFNLDRMEVLRGSASMLFGRGSTGGAVNMVSKTPRLSDDSQVDLTVGSHNYRRVTGDFNIQTDDRAALRINAMSTKADNNGAGSSLDKSGIAASYRWGIWENDEYTVSLYHLDNRNGMNYGLPWVKPSATSPVSATTVLPVDPSTYYGMASDRNNGTADYLTFSHTHRFDADHALTTQLRRGNYTRDQRASAIRFCTTSNSPTCPSSVALDSLNDATPLRRGTNNKIQDLGTLYAQSDYSAKFEAWGMRHELQAGVDLALERKQVYTASGGLTKPNTSIGTPDDGAWINENSRTLSVSSRYNSQAMGLYVQDLIQFAPNWKWLGGLRYDRLDGDYDVTVGTTAGQYRMRIGDWSQRTGVLYQPNALSTYYASAATSFNTSGDAYSLSAANQNTPPEQSINLEIGAKFDSADKQTSYRFAVFRTTKLHERNTDPTVDLVTLSGKRHVAGFEAEVTGRLTPRWEVFASYTWLPIAIIDEGAPGAEGQGTRPSLTPLYSGTVWSTYQIDPRWRVGGGLNWRGPQTPNRNPGWTVPGFVTADLMAEYRLDFDHATIKANLTNLTNRLYADALYTGHYIPGPGRQLQVTLSLQF